MEAVVERLAFVAEMHKRLRWVCPEAGTDEGHFVNENTVVRLAVLMEDAQLKPKGKSLSPTATAAEKAVRTLFMFRNRIVHGGGSLNLQDPRVKGAPEQSYQAFCASHCAARVADGGKLCLAADTVVSPLIQGCLAYAAEQGRT